MPKINTDLHAPTVSAYRCGKETTVVIEQTIPGREPMAGAGTARRNDRDVESQQVGYSVAYVRALRDLADQVGADVERQFRVTKATARLIQMLQRKRALRDLADGQ